MGKRLTKIYTRTGDDGTTGLGSGERVPKEDPRVEAYGTVDELNSAIGMLLADPALPTEVSSVLGPIQHRLFDLGGELSVPGRSVIDDAAVAEVEKHLDSLNASLPALRDFVLPGGSPGAAACHLARAICRRAERRAWALSRQSEVNAQSLRYLNRVSDLLFVMARVICRHQGGREVIWEPRKP